MKKSNHLWMSLLPDMSQMDAITSCNALYTACLVGLQGVILHG